MIQADVTVDPNEFGPGLLREWASTIRAALDRAAGVAQREARILFRRALTRRLEYQALFQIVHTASATGLQGELGLWNPSEQAGRVVDLAVDALVVRPLPVQANWFGLGRITNFGGLTATIVPSDLSFLIDSDAGWYTSEGGHEVSWLAWLLEAGTDVILNDYYVMYGTGTNSSRTGDAIMVPAGNSGKNFRIKPHYAGVPGNNWITRAAMDALGGIAGAMQEAVRRQLA